MPDDIPNYHCKPDAPVSSPQIVAVEETEVYQYTQRHDRFRVWKGRDCWHKTLEVQIRLEPEGYVYVSTNEDHPDSLNACTVTLEQLHAAIRSLIATA